MELKDILELYEELDKTVAYKPNSMVSNMWKVNHIKDLKHKIALSIDIDEYRKYLEEKK